MTEGWKCPGCGKCYAPYMPKCESCGNETKFTIPPIQMPECEHIWGAPRTNGVFCTKCGVQQLQSPLPTTTCEHEWMGSSHGDYCADCHATRNSSGTIDITKTNCGMKR